MQQKFKEGDQIRCIEEDLSDLKNGSIYTVREIHKDRDGYPDGVMLVEFPGAGNWWYLSRFELVKAQPNKKDAVPSFILYYENLEILPGKFHEPFATEKEVRARILALAATGMDRETVVVHEIKNTRKVQLGTSIKFTK